jgi:hypothetical protein
VNVDGSAAFELLSVVHLVRPAGEHARDLEALHAGIERAPAESIFYHAILGPLRRPDSRELPADDFSDWVNGVLQDRETAERMSFAVQGHGGSHRELRQALLDALGGLSESQRRARAAPVESEFVFLAAESVRVPIGTAAHDADELVERLAGADPGVWFYHLIEEPWYQSAAPSVIRWAQGLGETRLASLLEEEARSGRGLEEMRRRLLRRWRQGRLHGRVAAAAAATESERREAGRAAVAGLVRRITRGEGPLANDGPARGER